MGVGMVGDCVPPSPSWPWPLAPQQCTIPSTVRAQVCESPPAALRYTPGPATRTGALRLTVVASPSCPDVSLPQQYTSPVRVTPQLCAAPDATLANDSSAATRTGVIGRAHV